MAEGVDLYCAEAVLELREKYPYITLTAVIPHAEQSKKWSAEQKARYQAILQQIGTDNQIIIHQRYTPRCMLERNQYMVNLSERVIAVYDGASHGGTLFTLVEAIKRKLEVVMIDPEDRTIQRINHFMSAERQKSYEE